MSESSAVQIITFYQFKEIALLRPLEDSRQFIRDEMISRGIKGTLILAEEGVNSTIAGEPNAIAAFVTYLEDLFDTTLVYKSSYSDVFPFRKIDVKIKPEIVTLKRSVDISKGAGTHVSPTDWNDLISLPDVILLDTRNDYEFNTGTFEGALNPGTEKFSDLPEFVEQNLSEHKDKKIAMFCTGGIRCEKFAPYMLAQGFREVYQLQGGILKYLEEVGSDNSKWQGECYVFDTRVTVDHDLKKGEGRDLSQLQSEAEIEVSDDRK
ncbi:MAG: hypothetical protein KF685_04290 [Acidobacteria bacterium]|nr:hypothetical protein [Acidobacteriota bacterium]